MQWHSPQSPGQSTHRSHITAWHSTAQQRGKTIGHSLSLYIYIYIYVFLTRSLSLSPGCIIPLDMGLPSYVLYGPSTLASSMEASKDAKYIVSKMSEEREGKRKGWVRGVSRTVERKRGGELRDF